MSTNWDPVPLHEILKHVARPVHVKQEQVYREIGIRSHAKGVFHKPPVSGAVLGNKRVFWVEPGDFVLNIVFAWEGAVAVLSDAEAGMIGSHRFPTFRAEKSRLDSRFLLAYFRTAEGRELLGKVSPGGAGRNRTLSRTAFLQEMIPLPPLPLQQRLMARIEELTAQIDEARTLRYEAALEAEAFVVSVHLNLAARRTKKLSEILRLDEDAAPVSATGSYPQAGIRSFGAGLFPKPEVKGSGTTYRAFNRLYDGAVVVSQVKGWEGAVAVCPPNLAGRFVSPEYRTFRCVPSEARPLYLASLVRTDWFWRKLAQATRGVGARRERTRPEQFLNIELPMPDVRQQEVGEGLFLQVGALRGLQRETGSDLESLVPAIVNRVFVGQR